MVTESRRKNQPGTGTVDFRVKPKINLGQEVPGNSTPQNQPGTRSRVPQRINLGREQVEGKLQLCAISPRRE